MRDFGFQAKKEAVTEVVDAAPTENVASTPNMATPPTSGVRLPNPNYKQFAHALESHTRSHGETRSLATRDLLSVSARALLVCAYPFVAAVMLTVSYW
jgi:hypothetical protein